MKAESIKSDKDTYIDLNKYLDGVLSIVDQLIEIRTQSGISLDSAALRSYSQAKESLLVQLIPKLMNQEDPEISSYSVKMIFSALNWAKQLVASTPRTQLASILLLPNP